MKKITLGLVTGLSLLLLAGCGEGSSGTEKDSGSKDMTIEVVAKGFQHDFWKAVQKGAKQAAEENGAKMNFVGPKDENRCRRTIRNVK